MKESFDGLEADKAETLEYYKHIYRIVTRYRADKLTDGEAILMQKLYDRVLDGKIDDNLAYQCEAIVSRVFANELPKRKKNAQHTLDCRNGS